MQPTPWTLSEYGTIKDANHETLRVTGISMPCGRVDPEDDAYKVRNLLMAAPDLLEALEELRYQSMNLCTGKPARCFDETISRVDAAIAKAKGE